LEAASSVEDATEVMEMASMWKHRMEEHHARTLTTRDIFLLLRAGGQGYLSAGRRAGISVDCFKQRAGIPVD
jgi:hypothetical protein